MCTEVCLNPESKGIPAGTHPSEVVDVEGWGKEEEEKEERVTWRGCGKLPRLMQIAELVSVDGGGCTGVCNAQHNTTPCRVAG